ncbi:unnamed protein product [Nyctereutes procyonoides]|uniref:(raccoon dog) hypothetical protein n=1 Tax=Nyctereutes procyonoides TaxID=34880 RepID=A0A811Y4M2_NYCPR|nr:unnamed protein product [Nyctereutes procyonoides]
MQRNIGYFDNLKVNARSITDSLIFVTKSSDQNLVVFLNKIQTTILDLIYLLMGEFVFGFNPYFFQHNSLCVGNASKRVSLQGCAQMGFLVLFIMPLLILLVAIELPAVR